jgi:hypothetical protein
MRELPSTFPAKLLVDRPVHALTGRLAPYRYYRTACALPLEIAFGNGKRPLIKKFSQREIFIFFFGTYPNHSKNESRRAARNGSWRRATLIN